MDNMKKAKLPVPFILLAILGLVVFLRTTVYADMSEAVPDEPAYEAPKQIVRIYPMPDLAWITPVVPQKRSVEQMDISKPYDETPAYLHTYSEADVMMLAQTVWGEARGCSRTGQAAVVECILNRVDCKHTFPDTIQGVVTQKSQFFGYSSQNPVKEDIRELVVQELERWCVDGEGRVLPEEYLYFSGGGRVNHFTTQYCGGTVWDWSWPSPYEEESV